MFVTRVQQQDLKSSSAAPGSLQHTLEERISLYKTAIQNSKTAGEASKARRYERGLKVSRTSVCFTRLFFPRSHLNSEEILKFFLCDPPDPEPMPLKLGILQFYIRFAHDL